MKQCPRCKIIKSYIDYYKGRVYCIKCEKERCSEYGKTIKGLTSTIYRSQKASSIKRNHPAPNYSLQELREWIYSHQNFESLYNKWVKSGYKKGLKPSCDRLNDYNPYTFDNLRLITWGENKRKHYLDKKNGIYNKYSKAILQYDMNNNLIEEHYSIQNASRITGVLPSGICEACKGKYKYSGGYIWKYKEVAKYKIYL